MLRDERSFALRVRRVGDHNFTSKGFENEMGAKILESFPDLKVDLRKGKKYSLRFVETIVICSTRLFRVKVDYLLVAKER